MSDISTDMGLPGLSGHPEAAMTGLRLRERPAGMRRRRRRRAWIDRVSPFTLLFGTLAVAFGTLGGIAVLSVI